MIPSVTLVMELLNASGVWTRQPLGILSNIFYVFDLILWFKHGQGGIYLPILSLWGLKCTFYGPATGSGFICVATHA